MLTTSGSGHALPARPILFRTGEETGSPLPSPQVSLLDKGLLVEPEGEVELEAKSTYLLNKTK